MDCQLSNRENPIGLVNVYHLNTIQTEGIEVTPEFLPYLEAISC